MEGPELWNEELEQHLVRLFIALGIGFLIGLEREYAKRVVEEEEQYGGVRTHTLLALFGFLAAFLAQRFGAVLFIAMLAVLMALVIVAYVKTAKPGSIGITTELSGMLTFLLGAVVFHGDFLLAVIVAVIVTLLLSFKLPLHKFIATLTPQEIRAFVQFVIISAIVLPSLPSEPFGPGEVWDLRNIWTMVVLVSGISLAGYLLSKILGARKGTILTGVVGGMVSSTAVTLGLSRRTQKGRNSASAVAAVGIVAASAVLYPRILIETWVVNRELALRLAVPALGIAAAAFAAAFLIHRRGKGTASSDEIALSNPLNFRVALQFALIYMAVLWLISLAEEQFSTRGLYGASLIFGTTDMDAITLTVARKSSDPEAYRQGTIAILLATLSNTVMKYGIVLFFGDRSLRKPVGIGFGAIAATTVLALVAMHMI